MRADDREVIELRRGLARLKAEARKNDEAWRRSKTVEIQLLEAESLSVLLERLTAGIGETYGLDEVTLTVADPQHEIRRLLLDQGADAICFSRVSFVDDVVALAPRILGPGRPWLGRYVEAEHARFFGGDRSLTSVALLPMPRQRRIVASLNLGSADLARFTPQHGTDFLAHLGVIGGFCLENTINRARLTRSGFTDALTGWHNRRYLQTRLQEEIARGQRGRSKLVCLMLDIDYFKAVNDRLGHLAGDEVLRQFARCVSGEVRASDVAARYGGEEFVILLPSTAMESGRALAERIRAAVAATAFTVPTLDQPLTLTVSIGIAEYVPDPSVDPTTAGERLLAAADLALYEAKAAGRDRVALAASA